MTLDDARGVLLSFEGAVESAHHGHPDFRVKNKIFTTLRPEQDRSVLRLPPPLAESFIKIDDEDAYKIVSNSGGCGWLSVRLESIPFEEFHALAEAAYVLRKH
jgi:hypothetical protein